MHNPCAPLVKFYPFQWRDLESIPANLSETAGENIKKIYLFHLSAPKSPVLNQQISNCSIQTQQLLTHPGHRALADPPLRMSIKNSTFRASFAGETFISPTEQSDSYDKCSDSQILVKAFSQAPSRKNKDYSSFVRTFTCYISFNFDLLVN